MKKSCFVQHLAGAVIYVCSDDPASSVIHGFNLESPNLRTKCYAKKDLQKQSPVLPIVIRALRSDDFYVSQPASKYYNPDSTRYRLQRIKGAISMCKEK